MKIVLGWELNTRALMINLPDSKHTAWQNDIDYFLASTLVKAKELEQMLGRLNHVAFIIPLMRHFLNHIHCLFNKAAKSKCGRARMTEEVRDNLKLCSEFLTTAHAGISMNLIVFRKPTHEYVSNASEHGIGVIHLPPVKLGALNYQLTVNIEFHSTV